MSRFPVCLPSGQQKGGDVQDVQKALPEAISRHFSALTQGGLSLNDRLFFRLRLFDNMHDTWKADIRRKLPKELQPLMALLEKDAASTFRDVFLDYLLLRSRVFEEVIPQQQLPSSSFDWMLSTSYEDLVSLIEVIAMVDVVDEIRRILDRNTLQKVLSHFTDLQQKYLKSLLHRQPKIVRIPLDLVQKIRQGVGKEVIRTLVYEHGLYRLGNGVFKESEGMIWHIAHKLDLKSGNLWREKMASSKEEESSQEIKTLIVHAHQYLQAAKKKKV